MKLTKKEKSDYIIRFTEIVNDFKGHPKFIKVLLDMMEVHHKKSNDYATDESPFSNIELCEKAGFPAWKGVIIRLGDKYSRLLNALAGKLLKCESISDAFIDNACYSVIGLIEYEKYEKEAEENTKKEM